MVYWCITPGSSLGYPGFESWLGHQLLWTRFVTALDSSSIQLLALKSSMTTSTSFPIHPIIPVSPTKLCGVTSPKKTVVLYSLSWEPQNLTKRKGVFCFCYLVHFVSCMQSCVLQINSAYDALIWMVIINICLPAHKFNMPDLHNLLRHTCDSWNMKLTPGTENWECIMYTAVHPSGLAPGQ
jgi:hypothetical protein